MTRRLALALVALAAWPAGASAKEIASVRVCGASECRELRGPAAQGLGNAGPMSGPPESPAGFFTFEITMHAPDSESARFSTAYVPDAHMLLAADGSWLTLSTEDDAVYAKAVRGLEELPASKLAGLKSNPLPAARVHKVYDPGARPAVATGGGGFPWAAAAVVAALLVGGLGLAARYGHPAAVAWRSKRPARTNSRT